MATRFKKLIDTTAGIISPLTKEGQEARASKKQLTSKQHELALQYVHKTLGQDPKVPAYWKQPLEKVRGSLQSPDPMKNPYHGMVKKEMKRIQTSASKNQSIKRTRFKSINES